MGFLFKIKNMSLVKEAQINQIKNENANKCTECSVAELFCQLYIKEAVFCTSWGQFLIFNGIFYQRMEKNDVKKIIINLIKEHFPKNKDKATYNMATNIFNNLTVTFPNKCKDTELAHNYFAFSDCLYNTDTHETQPHTSDIRCFKFVNVSTSDFKNPYPAVENYLTTTLVNKDKIYDPDLMDVYQEMVGSLFDGKRDSNRAFFLWGGGSNGKSVTTELLLSLFEAQYTASASLDILSQRFGRARLVGKLLNVCSEEESQYLKHDIFKALVTGEEIDAERKNEDGFSYHNFAKLVFATNNFPKFSDMDYSTKRRIIVIPFNNKFEENKDFNLLDKLKSESAQFVNFALQGLKRLQKNNYKYSISAESSESLLELESESSSSVRYIQDELTVDPDRKIGISASNIYRLYREWAGDNGHKPVSSMKFFKVLSTSEKLMNYKKRECNVWEYYILQANIDDNYNNPIWTN